jgi:D-glycero-D-manno-heptose 1,7-bisphosphate phosphatase
MRPAAFLDRDGTVIEHVHHLADPRLVSLIPMAADGIRMMQSMGYACVIITNQSVVGMGKLSLEGLGEIHDVMHRLLEEWGVKLDGVYYCTHAPGTSDRSVIEHADRKPGPGMLLRAAREMNLDLTRSWMLGDMKSDMLAGRNAGVKGTILVRTGKGSELDPADPSVDHVADNLLEAARLIGRSCSVMR